MKIEDISFKTSISPQKSGTKKGVKKSLGKPSVMITSTLWFTCFDVFWCILRFNRCYQSLLPIEYHVYFFYRGNRKQWSKMCSLHRCVAILIVAGLVDLLHNTQTGSWSLTYLFILCLLYQRKYLGCWRSPQ